ncbi:hypothetical protein TrVFT333_010766 [Trichoderma virens FT-333]|nr:hypothetical protein TrVFT333_010766 [Trichoderma virens FT-333]
MADVALAPREPSIVSPKLEMDEESLSNSAMADTAPVAREFSIESFDFETHEEGLPDANITNATLMPRELTIESLDLGKNDEDFADGIACVQAYWAQASQMDATTQEHMRHLIITKQFSLTFSSRQSIFKHRLYRGAIGQDEANTWPIFLILRAIYKDLPQPYIQRLRAKGLVVKTSDHTDDYMAAYPDTIRPRIFDTDTIKGREYRERWPRLRNTPSIYRKSRFKDDKQPTTTATQAAMKPTASRSTASSSLWQTATGSAASTCPIAQQPQKSDKKRPAPDLTIETQAKRLLTRDDDFEFDKVLMQMTLPGVPSRAPTKINVEKELADLKEDMAKMHQQMQTFMKVTADVVTSMKTEIEDLKEQNRLLKK